MRNKFVVFWIWMLMLPLAFDFKSGENASKLIQILLTIPPVLGGLILVLIAPRFTVRSRLRTFITCTLVLTIAGSAFTQILQGNDIGNYLRVVLPFLLFLLGYVVAYHPWNQERLEQIERAMFWSMVFSLFFSFAYGVATIGVLDDLRFRIVSVTFLCLQGLLLHEFVVAKRMGKVMIALFLVTVVIELLSVTRSLLVGTILLFIFATWLSAPSLKHLLKAGVRAAAIGSLIGAMTFGAAAMFPGVAEHWVTRIFASQETASGRDPTTITRLAEMKDQFDQTMSSAESMLTGMGYGHYYRYSPSYLPDLAGQISLQDFYAINEWTAGHNFWVYQIFAGGLLFGLALPLGVLWALYRGSVAYRSWRRSAPGTLYLPVLGRALLVLAALPATSIGGNPLGNRHSGLVFGIALGLLVATCARIAHASRMREAQSEQYRRASAGAEPVNDLDGDIIDAPESAPMPQHDMLPPHTTPSLPHVATGRHSPPSASSSFAPTA